MPGTIAWDLVTFGLCVLTGRLIAQSPATGSAFYYVPTGISLIALAAAMLVCSAYMYKLGLWLRVGILMTPPLGLFMLTIFYGKGHPNAALVALAAQAIPAVIIAWCCRPMLRGFVRACCPNPSRGIFAGLWAADDKPIDLSPW